MNSSTKVYRVHAECQTLRHNLGIQRTRQDTTVEELTGGWDSGDAVTALVEVLIHFGKTAGEHQVLEEMVPQLSLK